jgi:hypothetical protein
VVGCCERKLLKGIKFQLSSCDSKPSQKLYFHVCFGFGSSVHTAFGFDVTPFLFT